MSKPVSLKSAFDVWTDGSYQSTRHRGGIGAVIQRGDDQRTFSAPLPKLDHHQINHGSDFAELYALGSALDKIPPDAVIRLRMDCQNVIGWLKGGRLTCKKETVEALEGVFNFAMRGVGRMKQIEFIHASDRNNEGMKLAHRLSREGADMVKPHNG